MSAEQAGAVLRVATAQVRAYVRGGPGWVPNDELASVILGLAARLVSHPRMIAMDETEGPSSASYRSSPGSFTVSELFTLNRHRQRAL
ncbi:hypothetical protein [Mycobacterium sp. 852013-51886_SCH5428379]|uniref:hypothetical protein n=1 Tax=Mycobacterium sp. 852013-51886_SCH5428379 TaxID=1834111 RepID=UPI001E5F821E|nr:hypothetical protein [Mycobacterium sp. 852013-51886_SCH5428379]